MIGGKKPVQLAILTLSKYMYICAYIHAGEQPAKWL